MPRHPFGGVAELLAVYSNTYIIGSINELSRFGCFVQTCKILPVGTKVTLKVTHGGSEFNTLGEVIHILFNRGMGIQFGATGPKDEELLENWLLQMVA